MSEETVDVATWEMTKVWTRVIVTEEMWPDSGVLEGEWSRREDSLIGKKKGGIENGSWSSDF